jgi:predicted DNA-binding protein with PD1-like motif
LKTLARRLMPGQDLYLELARLADEEALDASVILSGVGSFSTATIRFADHSESTILSGPLEIVSITGTVSKHGMHVHVSVSDHNGATIGGHLTEGSRVYTTIELVLLDLSQTFIFERALCPVSKFEELLVQSKNH